MQFMILKFTGWSELDFIFVDKNGREFKFKPYELNIFDLPIQQLVDGLKLHLGKCFKVIFFWEPHGYYVAYNMRRKYEIFDAQTKLTTGLQFDDMHNVPTLYRNKIVQRIKAKRIIKRISSDSIRT